MARSLSDILNEAEGIIEKRASEKPVAQSFDAVEKYASFLNGLASAAPSPAAPEEFNLLEKIAHAIAIVDTLTFLEEHEKIAQFEDICRERGYSEEQIAGFIEKKASGMAVSKGMSRYLLPAALAAGAGTFAVGHHKGKKKGYNQALDDISAAMSQPPSQE